MSAQDCKNFERRQGEEKEADAQTRKRSVPWRSSVPVAGGEAEGLKKEGGGRRRRRIFHNLEMAPGLRPVVAQTVYRCCLHYLCVWLGRVE